MTNKLIQFCKYALFGAIFVLSSCVTDEFTSSKEPSVNAKNLEELVAPSNFNWTTSQTVSIDLTGLNTVVPIKSTLSISTEYGVIYRELALMSESKTYSLDVPSNCKVLKLQFGAVSLESPIQNKKASFSFIPVIN